MGKRQKKIVYVDMDNTLVDFKSGIRRLPKDVRKEYKGHFDDAPGIFALMDPMPRAVRSYLELAKQFDTYVLSTAPWENPSAWSDKLLWVQRHLGDAVYKRLILTHHKDLSRGDFLIDDRTARGADRFKGRLIRFGSDEYPDWPAVMEFMRERASS